MILAVGNGALQHQSTKEIFVQNTENQKIGLLDGFHFNLLKQFFGSSCKIL
jgi:hypothetical protein